MTNEQAIKTLKKLKSFHNGSYGTAIDEAIKALEQQPKTGEWIDKGYDIGNCWATCSECDGDARGYAKDTGWGHDYYFPKFCPHCGARMNGGGEDAEELTK